MPPGLNIEHGNKQGQTNKKGNRLLECRCLFCLLCPISVLSSAHPIKWKNQSHDALLKIIPKPNTGARAEVTTAVLPPPMLECFKKRFTLGRCTARVGDFCNEEQIFACSRSSFFLSTLVSKNSLWGTSKETPQYLPCFTSCIRGVHVCSDTSLLCGSQATSAVLEMEPWYWAAEWVVLCYTSDHISFLFHIPCLFSHFYFRFRDLFIFLYQVVFSRLSES